MDDLQSQFRAYEQTQEQVEHILQHWDREEGSLLVPLPIDASPAISEMSATEKQVNISLLFAPYTILWVLQSINLSVASGSENDGQFANFVIANWATVEPKSTQDTYSSVYQWLILYMWFIFDL